MTKQDIRDEFKDQEGDPHVKGRIRQQQRAIARRRMMADVPKADVIVTNPTHYAVALQYNDKNECAESAGQGAGEIALRIRELGAEHRIPMLEAAAGACAVSTQRDWTTYSGHPVCRGRRSAGLGVPTAAGGARAA